MKKNTLTEKNSKGNDAIKDCLAKKHLCYVLLTCDKTHAEGEMEVEMSYEGDPVLASYLLQNAQHVMDEHVECKGSF